MNARVLSLAAALILAAGGVQAATDGPSGPAPAASAVVNHWLYDVNGEAIGSVRKLTDGGQTAVIMIGLYLRPGSHEASVPASALALRDGRVFLEPSTVQALNLPTRH